MSFASFDLAAFEAATGADRAALAADLDRICRETGFLVLTGHGIARDVIAGQWDAVDAFFAQGPDAKHTVAPPAPGAPYGYLGPQTEALAKSKGEDTPPDLKESFNGGPLEVPPGIIDPDALAFCYRSTPMPDLPEFASAWTAYYAAMVDLAARVMAAMAAALKLPEDHFAPFIDAPISALRALHYPAMDGPALARQQRAGAHTDYGSLTILLPQAGSSGLQIKRGDDWIDVPTPKDAFVVNIGDLMAHWTADAWVSTLHRVVARENQPARKSLAFFHQPNWDADIMSLDGSDSLAPIKSGPYLMRKFQSTGS